MHLLYVAALPGLHVGMGTSGAEALERAREQSRQLRLTHLHLPDIDAPARLRRLRDEAARHEVPALVRSADDGPTLRRCTADAGFAGCRAQPLDGDGSRRELAASGRVFAG